MTEEQIAALRERLNTLSDKMNVNIHQEEVYLKTLSFGVRTYINTKSGYELGYDKIGREWRIVARATELDGTLSVWTLDKAPRGIRFSALKHFPELRESIYRHAESLANRIERALAGESDD